MRQRNVSIDILKCLAAILITNSHMGMLYGKYNALATGGAIGDALFFFCSGFTLFLGRDGDLLNWYKRRINRIYPTVFAWALTSSLLFGRHNDMKSILLTGGGWFVSCIMIYYVILWIVRRYMMNHLRFVFGASVCMVAACFGLMSVPEDFNMYGATYFKWCFFFLFMLQGAMTGKSGEPGNTHLLKDGSGLLSCIIIYYAMCAFRLHPALNALQILSILPLLGVCFFSYRVCNTRQFIKYYHHRIYGWMVRFIGGLCLEIYLVQYSLFTDKMNGAFPLNIPAMFVMILVAAYLLRCLARIWSQTFKEQNYNWPKVFAFM